MMRTALTGGNSTAAPSSHCCKSWGSNKLSDRLSAASIRFPASVSSGSCSALAAVPCSLPHEATTAGHDVEISQRQEWMRYLMVMQEQLRNVPVATGTRGLRVLCNKIQSVPFSTKASL